jgi:hypothetical protein
MALPTAPTISSLCTEAFTRCGVSNPTAEQLARAERQWFEEVKRDLAARKDWHTVEETMIIIPSPYVQVYAMPGALMRVMRMRFYRGEKTGQAQGSGSNSITVAAGTGDVNDLGKKMFLTEGTGAAQSGRIIDVFGDEYTMSCPWETLPATDTEYVIAETETWVPGPAIVPLSGIGASTQITGWNFIEQNLQFWPVLDDENQYAIEVDGAIDLSLVDSNDARIVRLLREWREPLVRGMMVRIKEDHDDPDVDKDERKYERAAMNVMKQDVRKRLRAESPAFRSPGGGLRRKRY